MGINQGPEDGKIKSGKQQKAKPEPLRKEKGIIQSDYACALETLEGNDVPENEVRILLLGVDGSGKSTVRNLILGNDTFKTDEPSRGKTRTSSYATCVRNGRRFVVVETPCLFHTRFAPKFIITEVNKLIGLTLPGPHICIFVVPSVDLSSEEKQAMARMQSAFFPGAADNSMVALTKIDVLSPKGMSPEAYASGAAVVIKKIIEKCNNRVVHLGLTNGKEEDELQTKNLVDVIESMLDKNSNKFYTNEAYALAQVNMKVHKTQLKEKYLRTEAGISLLEKMKNVEGMRSRKKTDENVSNATPAEETLEKMESGLKTLTESMTEVVCDQVREGVLQESITPFELNLRRLITSGTKSIGSFLASFISFGP
ncbi:GTPase IMAP family member 7-like [Anneissia japonica]|uniref:GTPase IMAP family member 7-like n=1 Tax=Anneissia japonica TaxID=1529436 RepID=UPI001425784D|nr:GTPase IMAP family member 7-like [Anneissia japonica]